jgi:hypothetical protein
MLFFECWGKDTAFRDTGITVLVGTNPSTSQNTLLEMRKRATIALLGEENFIVLILFSNKYSI